MNFKEPIYISEEVHGRFRLRDGDGTVYSYTDDVWEEELSGKNIDFLPHGLILSDGNLYKLEDKILHKITDIKQIKKKRKTALQGIPDCFLVCEDGEEKTLLCVNQNILFLVEIIRSSEEILIDLADTKTVFIETKDDNGNPYILQYEIQTGEILSNKYLYEDIKSNCLKSFNGINHKTFAYDGKIYYPDGRELLHVDLGKGIESDYICNGANDFILSIKCNKNGKVIIWVEGEYNPRFEIFDLETKTTRLIKEPIEEEAYFFGWMNCDHIWMKLIGNSPIWIKNISDNKYMDIAETYIEYEEASEDEKYARNFIYQ